MDMVEVEPSHDWVRLIVKASVIDLESSNKLDQTFALPFKLLANSDYHVTLAILENVPIEKAQEIKLEVYRILKQIHPIKEKPLYFDVQEATTFARLGSSNYRSRSVILVPKNKNEFIKINHLLEELLKANSNSKYSSIGLDRATSNENYIPHITLHTPRSPENSDLADENTIDYAILNINSHLLKSPSLQNYKIKLGEYRISIQK